ncbi:prolipoprotein diacylglyceryl transferase, partial [Mycobacterium tuberculosis]|nr:prolipoprotein diacylglyceryl transferase [Mycobacterium tuberculosis]
PAHHVGQWRLNDVTALVVFTGAVVILIVLQRRYGEDDEHSSCSDHKTR